MTAREEALSLFQKCRKLEIADGHNGFVQCPYCRRWIRVEDAVAVHYIPRQFRSLEIEPRNVYAGCSACNSADQLQSNSGDLHERYRAWIVDNFGEHEALWLENRKRVLVKHGTRFYKEKIEELKKWLKARKERNG